MSCLSEDSANRLWSRVNLKQACYPQEKHLGFLYHCITYSCLLASDIFSAKHERGAVVLLQLTSILETHVQSAVCCRSFYY